MNCLLQSIWIRLLSLLPKSRDKQPIIRSYGQAESNVALEDIQPIMEWLFLTIINAGYIGQAHLFWLQPEEDVALNRQLQQLYKKKQLILGYRCGDRTSLPPTGFYWRLMPEHSSLRIYQLEVKQDS